MFKTLLTHCASTKTTMHWSQKITNHPVPGHVILTRLWDQRVKECLKKRLNQEQRLDGIFQISSYLPPCHAGLLPIKPITKDNLYHTSINFCFSLLLVYQSLNFYAYIYAQLLELTIGFRTFVSYVHCQRESKKHKPTFLNSRALETQEAKQKNKLLIYNAKANTPKKSNVEAFS